MVNKQTITPVLLVIFGFAAGIVATQYLKPASSSVTPPPINPTPTSSVSVAIETITLPPSPTTSDISQSIKLLFSQKYQKPLDQISLKVSRQETNHASGSVSFAGEAGGGLWLAANTDSGWQLAYDGNGIVPCDQILSYNFPASMVSECLDENGQLYHLQ
jgi:hypothetical protein